MRLTPEATTPLEDVSPKRKAPSKSAAGLPAIISTAKHGLSKMGLIGSLTNFYKVNKFQGFDCPGVHGQILTVRVQSLSFVRMVPRQ